jgi:ribosomal protein L6P/L9E
MEEMVEVPKGLKMTIKTKVVTVTSKSGILTHDLEQLSMLRSVCNHIRNIFKGVEKKFEDKMCPRSTP